MAALLAITLLLLCCSVDASTASQDMCDYNITTGANFTVPLKYDLKNAIKVMWKQKETTIFNRQVKDGVIQAGAEIAPDGSLKLGVMDKTKAGNYIYAVYNTEGNLLATKTTFICVFDRVNKPTVKAKCEKMIKPSKSTTTYKVQFTCGVTQENVQIQWLKNKNVIEGETGQTLMQDAQAVKGDSFSCIVSNPVESKVSDSVKQTCIKSEFSFLFDKLFGLEIWVYIVIGGGVVVLLILTISICCIMNRRRRRMNMKDEEELRLEWTNTEQHHHHHHPHNHKHPHPNAPADHPHRQQQQHPAGHTGPRQHHSKQHRQQHPRAPEPPGSHPQPSPRRPAQGSGPGDNHDDEQPPPLPRPRKKSPM